MNIEIGWEIFVINKNLSVFNKDFSAFLLTSLFLKTTKISRAVLYRVSAFHENPIGHSKGRKFWLTLRQWRMRFNMTSFYFLI